MPNCALALLPPVGFDYCDPKVFFGEVSRIALTRAGAADGFTNAQLLSAWTPRISQTEVLPAANVAAPIRLLDGIGSVAEPDVTEVAISLRRKVYTTPKNTVTFAIDDLSDENLTMVETMQTNPNATYKIWAFAGGRMMGGNTGVNVSIKARYTVPESREEVAKILLDITWEGVQAKVTADPGIATI